MNVATDLVIEMFLEFGDLGKTGVQAMFGTKIQIK